MEKDVSKYTPQKEPPTPNPMSFKVGRGRTPVVVEMEIMGLRINILPEETWKAFDKLMLWSPTFHLVGADQLGIKPLGMLMA